MRDLVLADQYHDSNIIFATQNLDGNINKKIIEASYPIVQLTGMDTNELIQLIKKYDIELLVIDHYEIDYDYEKLVKEQTDVTILSFDDTYQKHYCDILLNHNISANAERYNGLIPKSCEVRCGKKYTLLRKEFIEAKKQTKKIKQHNNTNKFNVLVAMGGADHSNINLEILNILQKHDNIHAHVVTTLANKNLRRLEAYCTDNDNVSLYVNTNDIAKLMINSDFAIVTPSVTLNELLFLEVPFIAIKTADNQLDMYEYLVNNRYMALDHFNARELEKKLELQISMLITELINFIDLSVEEKEMVLNWRNHDDIRKWMFTDEKIGLSEHLAYIERLKQSNDRKYFLVKRDTNTIGVIDFTDIDFEQRSAKFGLYSKPGLKGQGVLLMNVIITYAINILKIKSLTAEVFKENSAAIKLYKRCGFTQLNQIGENNLIQMEFQNENR